jgi:hypothetical protein
MSKEELGEAVSFINEHFVFLDSQDGEMPSVSEIINRAKQAVQRLGVRGLVIDPYNGMRMEAENEHQAITKMLSRMTAFAKAYGLAIFFIAHPSKLQRKMDGTYPVPKGMDISGSMAWFSKPDVGFTVHRTDNGAEIHCWKARFKWLGEQGEARLDYDVPTGRFMEPIRQAPSSSHWMDDWDK